MIKPWCSDRPPNHINDAEWVLQSPKSLLYIHVQLNEEHSEITRQAMAEIAEAMNELWEQRRGTKKKEKRSQTEMRVIELTEVVEGLDHPHIEHRIQYRNGSGPWTSLPVVRVFDREEYQRMKDGADD
jgi:phage pi2 protein 07